MQNLKVVPILPARVSWLCGSLNGSERLDPNFREPMLELGSARLPAAIARRLVPGLPIVLFATYIGNRAP